MDVVCQGFLRASTLVWRLRPDAWALTVACRAHFELAPGESPLTGAPMAPPEGEDDERRYVEPWGPVAPLKRWGEVVVVGHAHAPEGTPVRSLVARLAVGDVDKAVQIRADAGFTRGPAGFGPIRPEWPGRAQRLRRHAAGWDHARWVERPLPEDIDTAYFNVAPPDQVTDELTGAERIVLEHLHPRFARLITRLRAPALRAFTTTYGLEQRVPLRCDTLVIDADRGVAALVWRGQLLLDHPQREGVVVVTHDEAAPSSTGTMAPPLSSRSAAALPFQRTSAPAASAAPAADWAPDANGVCVPASPAASRPVEEEDPAQTQAPALEPAKKAALPFHAGGPSPLDDAPEGGPFTLRRAADLLGPPPSPPRAGDTAPPPSLAGDTASPSLTASDALHPDAPPAWRFSTAPPPPAPSAPPPRATPAPPWPSAPPPPATPAPPWPSAPPPPAPPAPPWPSAPPPPAPPPPAQRRVAEPAPAEEPSPAAVAPEQLPAGPSVAPALPVDEYPLARCAAIAAQLARRPESRDAILEAEALAPDTWEALHAHWLDAIRAGAARGSKALLSAYDAAYVGALEAERGPITAGEYARLMIAVERGTDREALADLRLPEGVTIRLRRVWLERIVRDPQAAQEVRKAMREAGQAS
ncbi:DUF2169 domain-containing protein [Sorangium sp. So ce1153]|uniref:DUF2169 domain-containing protein n=1 Tax=Sorangium sp. So ce1153 TaxID=3133333 RepID=UPI003F6375AE